MSLLYLLDIEGTVAPVSFVTETLFPYARARFANFLANECDTPEVRADLALLLHENQGEQRPAPWIPFRRVPESVEQLIVPDFQLRAVSYILWLMDRDRKSTALKSLQGKIWKAGYERGELKSVLFDDVPEAFARWSREGRVAIYSSGSAEAQGLFFRYSNFGDLSVYLSGYFDTRTGPKQASASYAAITEQMKVAPADVLFFSDVVGELDAARAAGCGTRLVVRPGNAAVSDANGHLAIKTLAGL